MSNQTKESRKLKDLIRIGVFTALWIAVGWVIACTIGFFPPVLVVLPCILAVAGGLIYVVMLSKLNIRGGIFIPSFIFGLCLFTMVPYGMLFICTSVGGLLGELIYDTAGKNSNKAKIIGISMPMIGLALGEYIPLCYMEEAFKKLYEGSFTSDIGMKVIELLSTQLAIVLTAVTVVCAILGCLWGNKIVKKRLSNAE
ncbi:MptD family putative ECF transporter S component [Luxibacter massiliensis]|uniref:MptD family putative ECF transporter S component n=1 Tax=Luxibacter massiliensis TaxID=2219695 RepID=UPI000F05CBCD|nr:MptD family putative ECF transporter S component [Luxibacter massiliensis]